MTTGRLKPTITPESQDSAIDLSGGRVFVDVTIPRTTVTGRMRLVGRAEALAILSETRLAFEARKLPTDAAALAAPGVVNEWNCEIAVRHLAIAVRDPADTERPLAPLDEWQLCDDDQISALWQQYQDLRERLDPLNADVSLTEAQFAAIASAIKKKERTLLIAFGCSTLSSYLLTTAAPPAT